MSALEALVAAYAEHIALPWPPGRSGAQRVIMLVYDKERERAMRARSEAVQSATVQAGHRYQSLDLAPAFANWMAGLDYRESYFASPDDLRLRLDGEFAAFAAGQIRRQLGAADDDTVTAVLGAGALFGFARLSRVLHLVEHEVRGRLLVFFPGTRDTNNNYRLLDARDGWNYLAVPIEAAGAAGTDSVD